MYLQLWLLICLRQRLADVQPWPREQEGAQEPCILLQGQSVPGQRGLKGRGGNEGLGEERNCCKRQGAGGTAGDRDPIWGS